MSELAIYTMLFFWLGVFATKAIFFFEHRDAKKKVYLSLSLSLMQTLIYLETVIYISAIKNLPIEEQEKELQKSMEIITEVALGAIPEKDRSMLAFDSWSSLKKTLKKLEEAASKLR